MSRTLYRFILRLHPVPFRDRFATEMLWIFDAECHRPALLLDCVVSLLRQHAKAETPSPAVVGFGPIETGIAPRRFIEAAVTATLFLASVLLLLNHPPRSITLFTCPPGAPRPAARPVHAPTRIQPLNVVLHSQPKNGYVQTGSAQVDNGVAGALRVLRSSTNGGHSGYCSSLQTN